LLCGSTSLLLFGYLERTIDRRLRGEISKGETESARHKTFALAGFTAFVTFYTFAGAPTLWKFPWAVPHLFFLGVVLTASAFLIRRLRRTQKLFAEETLARNIIKRWEWTDVEVPGDLREAFFVHTIRKKETAKTAAQILEIYKEAVHEALADGFVTRKDVEKLDRLRSQLQIKQADHEKVMAVLAEDERIRLHDPTRHISAEKRLQLQTYSRALEKHLLRTLSQELEGDDKFVMRLRAEYQVTKEEHEAVLDKLLGGEKDLTARLAEELRVLERAAAAIGMLELMPSQTHDFMVYLLSRRRARAVDRLMDALGYGAKTEGKLDARQKLSSADKTTRQSGLEQLRDAIPPVVAGRLLDSHREAIAFASMPLSEMLRTYTSSVDPYVRAGALYTLFQAREADEDTIRRLSLDEHDFVLETARRLRESAAQRAVEKKGEVGMSTIEKMISLRSAPIFTTLAPEDLADLARAIVVKEYEAGTPLCIEGESGNEVFIVIEGSATVIRRDGASERVVAGEEIGGLLGEMAALDPAPRSASVLAGKDGARVLCLDGHTFRNTVDANPTIASEVLRILVQRLRRLTEQ
jgi:hypothetical protein